MARGKAPKSKILGTKESTKKFQDTVVDPLKPIASDVFDLATVLGAAVQLTVETANCRIGPSLILAEVCPPDIDRQNFQSLSVSPAWNWSDGPHELCFSS